MNWSINLKKNFKNISYLFKNQKLNYQKKINRSIKWKMIRYIVMNRVWDIKIKFNL